MRQRVISEALDLASPLLARIPLRTRRRIRSAIDPTVAAGVLRSIQSRRKRSSGALVTIVVPVYNVQQYLPAFLASVVAQTHRNLEILVVNDGSPDRSADIARAWGLVDPRIIVIDQENGGLGAARNTGVREARGEYITFADSDDELHRNAISAMLHTIEQTGSDFVVGTMVRQQGNRRWLPHWTKSAHREDLHGIQLRDHPEIMLDVFACNKLWKVDFFRREVGGFPTRIAYEDQEPSIKSYLRATAFDVITDPVYYWRIRDDGSSISQQKAKLTDLNDRLTVTAAVAERIRESGDEIVRREWFRKLLAFDFIQYAEQVPRTGPDYFTTLSEGLQAIIEPFDDALWEAVPLYPRLAGYFAMQGDEKNLLTVLAGKIYRGTGYQLTETDDGVFGRPGYADEFTADVPDWLFRIDPDDLTLVTRAERVIWRDDTTVEITLGAYCRSAFDGELSEGAVRAQLQNLSSGEKHVLHGETVIDPMRNESAGSEWRDATSSGIRVRIDTAALESFTSADESDRYQLTVSVDIGGHEVTSVVSTRVGDAGASTLGFSGRTEAGRWVLTHNQLDGLVLKKASPLAVSLDESVSGRRVFLKVQPMNGKRIARLRVGNRRAWQSYRIRPTGWDREGNAEFDFTLKQLAPEHVRPGWQNWVLNVQFEDGTKGQIASLRSSAQFDEQNREGSSVMLDANGFGYLRIVEQPFHFTCDDIHIDSQTRCVTFSGLIPFDPHDPERSPELATDGVRILADEYVVDEKSRRYSARFTLESTDWAGRTNGLPSGGYTLRFQVRSGADEAVREQWATLSDHFANQLPIHGITDKNRVRVTRTAWGRTMWMRIGPVIADTEVGLRARREVIDEAIAATVDELNEAVVFESFHGKQVADSVRALHDRIRDDYPDVKRYWSVNSPAVSVPDGTTRIVAGTAEWMDAVHRSKYLVNNSNFPGYTRLRDGHRYLQTWHGTPMKKIAEDMPSENLSLGYRVLMRREVAQWEALLAQNPFSREVLPQAFRFDGPTLGLGYPRNDILRSNRSDAIRAEVRESLGISDEAPVVLYAPTFRDSKRAAGGYAFTTQLNFEEFQSALPDGAFTLVRGHANTVPTGLGADLERVIDVSTYGEISELFLASDVLVTDYSSLLFDYSVTRKPMLFFVPDLEEYESSTRGFYLQFRDICPGPLVRTTAETAAGVRLALADPQSFIDEKYTDFVERFAPWDDGHAAERVLEELRSWGWFNGRR